MPFKLGDRVRETTTTTGTGDLTLNGTLSGFQTFDSVLDTGDTTWYCVTLGAEWEVGLGTFTAPATLARTTVLASSAGGSAVAFSTGSKDAFITAPASALALLASLGSSAPLNSPAFTGTPTAPTATPGTNTTQLANTAFVQAAITALIASAPGALDTLDELAAALGDDANFAGTVTTALAARVLKAGDNLTGALNLAAVVDIASAATTDLGTANSNRVRVTGTTAITSFGTGANLYRIVRFAAALTLTHNATSLVLPGGANITTAADDAALAVSDGSGNWRVLFYQRADGGPAAATASPSGKQSIWIPTGAMVARTTNGAAAGTIETATNRVMVRTLDFDTSVQEFAQFAIRMPKSWNEGTVSFQALWSHAATTTNFGVAWQLQGVAVSDDDALDAAFGTAIVVTDTGGTTNDVYQTVESAAVTIAGTPAENDLVVFQVARAPANAGDTMAIDARLHGIVLFITTNAGNDA